MDSHVDQCQMSENMDDEFPSGFLAFNSDFEYSQACSFCSDFSLDVLELFINGKNFLCFFSAAELTACTFFCNLMGFHFSKYVPA